MDALAAWCRRWLGAPPAAQLFEAGYLSTVRGLRLDYTHTTATAPAEKARGKEVAKVAKNQTPMPVEIERLRLVDSTLGLVTPAKDRRVRVFINGADLDVTNLSSGFRKGPAKAVLNGHFNGSGSVHGTATFRPARSGQARKIRS